MAVLGVGPVTGMPATGSKAYGKARGKTAAKPAAAPSPSYYVEEGAPVGASKWLKSLLQSGAIRLSVDRITTLLGSDGAPAAQVEMAEEKDAAPAAANRDYHLFSQAVALEEADAEARKTEDAPEGWRLWHGPAVAGVAALVFLLTVALLDAAFGTRVLAALLSLVS